MRDLIFQTIHKWTSPDEVFKRGTFDAEGLADAIYKEIRTSTLGEWEKEAFNEGMAEAKELMERGLLE